MTYSSAVQRTYQRRKNFALAQPSSVVVLNRGSCLVLLLDGILFSVRGYTVRILDVYNAGTTENIIDTKNLLATEQEMNH